MQLEAKKNNFFSFFSGYLHLPLTAPRINIDIDDFYGPRKAEQDPNDPALPPTPPVEPDDFAVGRSPLPMALEPDPWQLIDPAAHIRPITPFSARLPTLPAKPLPPDPVKYSHGGGGDSPHPQKAELHIKVTYKDAGNQFDMRVDQVNWLHDNDIITVDNDVIADDGHENVAWPEHDVPSMPDLLDKAYGSVPEPYQPIAQPIAIGPDGVPVVGSGVTPEFVVKTLEAQADAHQGQDGPHTLHEGTTTDGVYAAPGSSTPPLTGPSDLVPQAPAKNPDTGESPDHTAVVKTGDNNVFNFGGIVDAQGNVGTMYVLGDSYRSDVIVQTNVIVDDSVVAGTADSAAIQAGGNQANNVAEFIQTLAQNPYEMGFFGGLHWNVDRVSGDYFNVNLTSQLNVMQDNDMVQQTATEHYKYYETGANEQGNGLVLDHSGIQYDLVVVCGNYYGANWIFQTNILLNSDYVLINGGSGGSDGEGSQTVSTGANWLMNSATLVDYSGGTHALTPDMEALVAALQGGQESLDLQNGFMVPGDGSGTLNVLFITGNYYDINVLEQTNIVNDSDVVVQTLENGETGYVSTGGNTLTNDALLATLGPLGGQYVGGNQYTEATLVQTNIITQSADLPPSQSTVVLNDPSKLAVEAAVVIEHSATPALPPPEQSAPPQTVDSASHTTTDPLSSVLS